MKLSARASIFTLALLVSTNAYASSAIVTSTVNLRTGPGTQYGTIGAIPNGVGIMVAGCTRGYGWCQVSYGGMTGWRHRAISPFKPATATRRTTISDRPPQRSAYRSLLESSSARPSQTAALPGGPAPIAAGVAGPTSIMAASGAIASRTGDRRARIGRTPRLARQSGLSSQFRSWFRSRLWSWAPHASRRQAVRRSAKPGLLTAFCQEHRRIGKG
ncbi:hypothetical protein C980_00761 [Brucella abortus 88/217]|nr:hypothetical protein C980_00761 [Brucella abortus 88/217]